MQFADLNISEFEYPLSEDRIAKYPLDNRDLSKLLQYKDAQISDHSFKDIRKLLKSNTQIVLNNTRVIQARLLFFKPDSKTPIEIFCLEPVDCDVQQAMATENEIEYYCLVGRAKKWKEGKLIIPLKEHELGVEKLAKNGQGFKIKFSWTGGLTFAEILEEAGHTPLPPYLKRADENTDKIRYQTVYAKNNGSVAAPTAGLHFTDKILNSLIADGHKVTYATLHVGAGTFKPVSTDTIGEHDMHFEEIHISTDFIEGLLAHKGSRTAVGTTSVRTLESLYWLGVKLLATDNVESFELNQYDAYNLPQEISVKDALEALLIFMQGKSLFTRTQLMIGPGYKFRMIDTIVTNFHQPKSTLLLLVAAATHGNWKDIYNHALQNNYRFLSYGDSSIIHI